MHPFSTPWCFQGEEKGCIGKKWVKKKSNLIKFKKWLNCYFCMARRWHFTTTEKLFLGIILVLQTYLSSFQNVEFGPLYQFNGIR